MSAKDWAESYLKLKVVPKKKRNYLEEIAGKNIYVLSTSGVAICGSCNKHINVKVRHKAECECPKCHKKMTAQHVWRMAKWQEEFDFLIVPQVVSGDCVVMRFILAERHAKREDYMGDNLDAIKGTPWNTREVARIYYNTNYADPVFYEYGYNWKTKKDEWIKGRRYYFRPDTYSICCTNRYWCMYGLSDYENATEEFNKLDCFKYYPLEGVWDENTSLFQIFYLMRTASINEKLAKMGLHNIIEANYQEWKNSDYYYAYKRKAWLYGNKPVLKTLHLTKPQFEIFKVKPSKDMQRFLQHHPDVTMEEMKAVNFDTYSFRQLAGIAVKAVSDCKDYRVVILDWKMPDMDGIEAARQIRAKLGDEVPILMISAYDWSDIEDEAKAVGINGFISKPLFRSKLYNKLNELLGNEKAQSEQDDEASDIAGMKILVAEDNDVNWEIISMLLEMHGVETERAENGQLAVERIGKAHQGDFDLIFMDIQMPVMNGIEATKAIRKLNDPWASGIPIIAMTADAFSENVAECMAAGMNGHIAKPVDMKVVLKEIKRIKEEIKNEKQ